MNEATDGEILDYAARESRVAITLDRDFPQILALTAATRPSVVLIRRQRLRAPELALLIASIWRDHESPLEQGCVLKIGARSKRVHRLPLKWFWNLAPGRGRVSNSGGLSAAGHARYLHADSATCGVLSRINGGIVPPCPRWRLGVHGSPDRRRVNTR